MRPDRVHALRHDAAARILGQDRRGPRLVRDGEARDVAIHDEGHVSARLVLRARPHEPEPEVGGRMRNRGRHRRKGLRPGPPLNRVEAELLTWYGRNGRDLPWRRTRDPYAILVSEVMLQQTQVARVVPRYEAWMERWPGARALAAAPAEVLREWIGLGYNARALRLREACAVVAREGWPRSVDGLRRLPGVGPYT